MLSSCFLFIAITTAIFFFPDESTCFNERHKLKTLQTLLQLRRSSTRDTHFTKGRTEEKRLEGIQDGNLKEQTNQTDAKIFINSSQIRSDQVTSGQSARLIDLVSSTRKEKVRNYMKLESIVGKILSALTSTKNASDVTKQKMALGHVTSLNSAVQKKTSGPREPLELVRQMEPSSQVKSLELLKKKSVFTSKSHQLDQEHQDSENIKLSNSFQPKSIIEENYKPNVWNENQLFYKLRRRRQTFEHFGSTDTPSSKVEISEQKNVEEKEEEKEKENEEKEAEVNEDNSEEEEEEEEEEKNGDEKEATSTTVTSLKTPATVAQESKAEEKIEQPITYQTRRNKEHVPRNSVCKWTWQRNTVHGRLPRILLEAQCGACDFCTALGGKCVPVTRTILVFQARRRVIIADDNTNQTPFINFTPHMTPVTVACSCVIPKRR